MSTRLGMGGRVLGPAPFLLAGIVNVTPDSFYDRGTHDTTDAAVAHALKLAGEGADMVEGEDRRQVEQYAQEIAELVGRCLRS